MAARILASNETQGYYNQEVYVHFGAAAGTVTADATAIVRASPVAGQITNVILSVGANAADATDTLSLKATVTKNGTAVSATDPAIAGGTTTAGSGARSTANAPATGLTAWAASATAANSVVAVGDVLKCVLDITAVTPDTNYTDVAVIVVIRPYAV